MDSVTADAAPDAGTAPAAGSSGRSLDALAAAVGAALAGTYALPIVVVQPDHDRVAVAGAKPLAVAHAALDPADATRVVELDLDTLPHHDVPTGGLRLWRQHGKSGAAGELVTELEHGDLPVQLVFDAGDGWRLVAAWCGSQGWVTPDVPPFEHVIVVPDLPESLFTGAEFDRESFVQQALAFEDAPYVWGGTTDAGVDCSGLVLRAAWRADGAIPVPRHSRALLKVGARVSPSKVQRGDVLVLQRDPATYEAEQHAQLQAQAERERATGAVPAHGPAIHPMHVAIALSADEVLHASRDAMRVVREPLDSLRARYRVLGVRRFGPAAVQEQSA